MHITYAAKNNNVSQWLESNRLSINLDETLRKEITDKGNSIFHLSVNGQQTFVIQNSALYLPSYFGLKNILQFQINACRKRNWTIWYDCKVETLCAKGALLHYYNSNTKSLIQYGNLVSGSISQNILLDI